MCYFFLNQGKIPFFFFFFITNESNTLSLESISTKSTTVVPWIPCIYLSKNFTTGRKVCPPFFHFKFHPSLPGPFIFFHDVAKSIRRKIVRQPKFSFSKEGDVKGESKSGGEGEG